MSEFYSDLTIRKVRDGADIRYCIPGASVTRATSYVPCPKCGASGKNKGLCVTHKSGKNLAKCFSCGFSLSDAIAAALYYVCNDDRSRFAEAVKSAADANGIYIMSEQEQRKQIVSQHRQAMAKSFCETQLEASGLTLDDVMVRVQETVNGETVERLEPAMRKGGIDRAGNLRPGDDEMLIYYYRLDGTMEMFPTRGIRGALRPYIRVRWSNPSLHTPEGSTRENKYMTPAGAPTKFYIPQRIRDLNRMRSVAVYYKEYSSIENLQLLGENYIKQMKRDLTPLTFQTSILCQRIGIAKDGFYSSMREKHKYNDSNFEYLDSLGYDFDPTAIDSRADKDVDPDAPLCIGMDYNANINWIVCGQPRGKHLLVLKSFFVKFERKIPELVDDFCRYYQFHRNKTVVYYWNATAKGSNYAVNEQDFHWVVGHEFERHGWTVIDVYLGNPMRHDEKYLLINQGFAGKQRLMPMFNRQNNDDLILAIQTAGVERGRNGFRKNKSGEKLAENEENLLEHRTDGTDAFDDLYIGCEKMPQTWNSSFSIIGIG